MFIVEMTFHALVFLYHGLLAVFSPRHRRELRESWRKASVFGKIGRVLSVGIAATVVVGMVVFWGWVGSARFGGKEVQAKADPPRIEIQLSRDKIDRLKDTREIGELAEVAKGIGAKWRERQAAKREGEPGAEPQDKAGRPTATD